MSARVTNWLPLEEEDFDSLILSLDEEEMALKPIVRIQCAFHESGVSQRDEIILQPQPFLPRVL